MKKFLSLLLCLTMLASLAACGNDQPAQTPTQPSAEAPTEAPTEAAPVEKGGMNPAIIVVGVAIVAAAAVVLVKSKKK